LIAVCVYERAFGLIDSEIARARGTGLIPPQPIHLDEEAEPLAIDKPPSGILLVSTTRAGSGRAKVAIVFYRAGLPSPRGIPGRRIAFTVHAPPPPRRGGVSKVQRGAQAEFMRP